jgi:hypothetical protein
VPAGEHELYQHGIAGGEGAVGPRKDGEARQDREGGIVCAFEGLRQPLVAVERQGVEQRLLVLDVAPRRHVTDTAVPGQLTQRQ